MVFIPLLVFVGVIPYYLDVIYTDMAQNRQISTSSFNGSRYNRIRIGNDGVERETLLGIRAAKV